MASTAYVIPFVVFVAFLGLVPKLGLSPLPEQLLWTGGMAAVIASFARPALDLRVRRWGASLALGVAVFLLWIGPDSLFPGYRAHGLFSNAVTGSVRAGLAEVARGDLAVLALRAMRAVLIVPIVEELFWRGWLMRWLIADDFSNVALGTYAPRAFWIVAAMFAAEHGPYWDVGLACGVLYNWWMVRTKSLGDLILVHGITNACLSAYVVAAGKWEYW